MDIKPIFFLHLHSEKDLLMVGEKVKMTNFLILLLLSFTSIFIDRTAANPVSIAIVKTFNKQNHLRMNEAPDNNDIRSTDLFCIIDHWCNSSKKQHKKYVVLA